MDKPNLNKRRIRAAYAAAESLYRYQFYFGAQKKLRELCARFEINYQNPDMPLGCTAPGETTLKAALMG